MKIFSSNRWHGLRGWVDAAPSFIVLLVLIVYPLGCLLLQSVIPHLFDFQMSLAPSLKPLLQVFSDSVNLKAILNSLILGVLAAALATVFGTITAFGVVKAPKPVRIVLDLFVWLVFFSPSYIIAEGWIVLMQDNGIFAQIFGLHNGWASWFFTRFGLVIVMGLRYFPYVHLAMVQAIQNLGDEMAYAGRLLGASKRRVFWKIILPLLTPAWLAGASISFAEGFGDFGFAAAITPQTHIPLITYQIYYALSEAPVNYSAAAGLSGLVVIVTAAALWLQFWWMKRKAYTTVSSSSKLVVGRGLRRMPIVSVVAGVLVLFSFVLPVCGTLIESLWKNSTKGMTLQNMNFHHYAKALQVGSDNLQSLERSLVYALISAIITATVGLMVAYQMNFRRSRANQFLNLVTMSTMAVPGVVMAAGFVFAWNAVWLIPIHLVLYGTSACLAMAYIASSLPYTIRMQVGALSQLSPNLMTAAQVLGAKKGTVLRRIVFPLVQATIISTFFMTFTGTIFELPASSLLYPAGSPPFAVAITSKFNAFEWAKGSALAMLGMTVVLISYGVGRYLVYRLQVRQFEVKSTATVRLYPQRERD